MPAICLCEVRFDDRRTDWVRRSARTTRQRCRKKESEEALTLVSAFFMATVLLMLGTAAVVFYDNRQMKIMTLAAQPFSPSNVSGNGMHEKLLQFRLDGSHEKSSSPERKEGGSSAPNVCFSHPLVGIQTRKERDIMPAFFQVFRGRVNSQSSAVGAQYCSNCQRIYRWVQDTEYLGTGPIRRSAATYNMFVCALPNYITRRRTGVLCVLTSIIQSLELF